MKFKINRDHFSAGLTQVLNIVGAKATMPVLNNVLIEAHDNQVFLTTTNLEMGIRCQIRAEVVESGAITLPVRKLSTIVRELPSLDVTVETLENHKVRIASGQSVFMIMGISSEEYPQLPQFEDQHSFVLSQSDLARMLKSVSYAQSTDESRFVMNGVFFNFAEEKLTLAATDGRRLAVISRELEVTDENSGSLILPAKTVAEVERLLNQGDTVKIAFNDRQVAFEIATKNDEGAGLLDAVYLVSKVVEGSYPNYRQVIPKQTDLHLKINRENLAHCVRRGALMVSDKSNLVRVHIAKNRLQISSSSPDLGESSDSIAVEYDGPDVTVAFNPQYMLDPLRALTRDDVIFEFKDELSPGVFRTPESFLCVIMPLRFN